ncbi:hypothetical protein [Niallia sp. Man26]|uniref:hypothetical protein n=1 Tax=Niallia sp. Man26 TaxID=2912824 RepID=UPI001EDA2E5F|nr:hypothetical protein [Niallia sp. Man26]UPO91384.1 hypothetical protein L8T27_028595 [Niallia sp. Man26]
MKIKFDYNNVKPQTIAEVLEYFMNEFKDFKIKENREEIGQVCSIALFCPVSSTKKIKVISNFP